jgi:hypothetical protein
VFLASASEHEGRIVIQLWRAGPVPPPVDGNVEPKPGDRHKTEWVPLRPVTLGETAQAFGVDGKPLGPKAVVQALAKPRGVVVFLRSYANDPLTIAPFYRDLVRDGTLILTVNPADLYNPPPQ